MTANDRFIGVIEGTDKRSPSGQGGRLVARRTRKVKMKAKIVGSVYPRVGNVVAIADPAHSTLGNGAMEFFFKGHNIAEHLTGMTCVGQAVNDRDATVADKGIEGLMVGGAHDRALAVTTEHPCGIFQTFPSLHLALGCMKGCDVTAETIHGIFEGQARARGWLHEEHRKSLAVQQRIESLGGGVLPHFGDIENMA